MSPHWQLRATIGLLLVLGWQARADQTPPVSANAPEMVNWDLRRLHHDPFKLIKATPDPSTGQVRFIIEFTRPPELAERYDWEHSGGPVVFRFADADGVVIRTAKPRLDGELIAEKGARIRLILQMPDVQTLNLTRSIKAE